MLEKNCKKILIVITLSLAVCLAAVFQLYTENYALKNPEIQGQKEIDSLVNKVSKLMVLPVGESPSIATVTDPEKLKDQPFFTNSMVGDKVLVYEISNKVILFRPSENKIIEVSQFSGDDEPQVSN